MDEARSNELDVPVVRAQRFELVDRRGRVRAVLGDIGGSGCYLPGLALRDVHDQEQACLVLSASGPTLAFAVDGNDVFSIGVGGGEGMTDDDADYDPTVHMVFSDGDGSPRIGLHVHHDGSTELECEGMANDEAP